MQVRLHAFLISSLDGGAVSFTPRPLIQSPRYQLNIDVSKKSLAYVSSLYFSYLSREFPRTLSLAEYHRRLESTYFMSTLPEDSYLTVRYAISTGQHLPMCQFSTVLRQTPVLTIRHCVSHQNHHQHPLCGHQTIYSCLLTYNPAPPTHYCPLVE